MNDPSCKVEVEFGQCGETSEDVEDAQESPVGLTGRSIPRDCVLDRTGKYPVANRSQCAQPMATSGRRMMRS